jgi:hypothetical protein
MHWFNYVFFALAFIAFTGFYAYTQRGNAARAWYSFVMTALWLVLGIYA